MYFIKDILYKVRFAILYHFGSDANSDDIPDYSDFIPTQQGSVAIFKEYAKKHGTKKAFAYMEAVHNIKRRPMIRLLTQRKTK